jgi:two-component system response regulator WspF
MRIAIVNDVRMAAETLRRVVASVPGYDVAWIAYDGAEAVSQCAIDRPDLILMDLIMPVMDGVEATRQIMTQSPCAILVVTATVEGNAAQVFQAMSHGALDAVNTPMLGIGGDPSSGQALTDKVATIAKLLGKRGGQSTEPPPERTRSLEVPSLGAAPPLIAIGSSTGGPAALAEILAALPANLRAAIVIAQHVDEQFSQGMADWLNDRTPLPVAIARPGGRLEVGKVLLAGTNDHLVVDANLRLRYTPEPRHYPYRPSVDVLFESLANHWPQPGSAIVLTGMGRDGARGLKTLRDRGWRTIAQDRATCVVYGMPKAAAELGAAQQVLPIGAIAPALLSQLR